MKIITFFKGLMGGEWEDDFRYILLFSNNFKKIIHPLVQFLVILRLIRVTMEIGQDFLMKKKKNVV